MPPVADVQTRQPDAGHRPTAWWGHLAEQWGCAEPGRQPGRIRAETDSGLGAPDGSRMAGRMARAAVDIGVIVPIAWGRERHSAEEVRRADDHVLARDDIDRVLGTNPRDDRNAGIGVGREGGTA